MLTWQKASQITMFLSLPFQGYGVGLELRHCRVLSNTPAKFEVDLDEQLFRK